MNFFAIPGALVGGSICDAIGRRRTFTCSSLCFVIGLALQVRGAGRSCRLIRSSLSFVFYVWSSSSLAAAVHILPPFLTTFLPLLHPSSLIYQDDITVICGRNDRKGTSRDGGRVGTRHQPTLYIRDGATSFSWAFRLVCVMRDSSRFTTRVHSRLCIPEVATWDELEDDAWSWYDHACCDYCHDHDYYAGVTTVVGTESKGGRSQVNRYLHS